MDNEVIEEVLRRIDSVGEAISQGAVAGFEVLVRQAMLSGIGFTVGTLFFFGLGLYIYRLSASFVDRAREELEARFDAAVSRSGYVSEYSIHDAAKRYVALSTQVTFGKIAGVLVASIGLTTGLSAVYRFANPGYYAIKEVLHIFG